MKDKIIEISGRGICGSSGLNAADFLARLKSGESSIKLIKEWSHLPIRMASIIESGDLTAIEQNVILADGDLKRSYMLQMALYEALNSAGLWIGDQWIPRSHTDLINNPGLFSKYIKKLPEKVGIFGGSECTPM